MLLDSVRVAVGCYHVDKHTDNSDIFIYVDDVVFLIPRTQKAVASVNNELFQCGLVLMKSYDNAVIQLFRTELTITGLYDNDAAGDYRL